MITKDNEKYKCILPQIETPKEVRCKKLAILHYDAILLRPETLGFCYLILDGITPGGGTRRKIG